MSNVSPNWSDRFGTRRTLDTKAGKVDYYSLPELSKKYPNIAKLPYSIKVLLEAALRQEDNYIIEEKHIKAIAEWNGKDIPDDEIPFKPARVVMQDFTGVPGVVDLAAMRDAIVALGKDPARINPVLPVDLVIDHSVQVDFAGSADSLKANLDKEFERNGERYEFLRWGSGAFSNFQVVPPATGIVHQVNLEYLAKVVQTRAQGDTQVAYPDSLVGTDSHTTMINGLGVLGWGVGGIEAEAVMLEQPIYMLIPEVVGFKLTGKLAEGVTATDLVLTIVEMLRKFGVVGKFVEFYGEGVSSLSLADRATIANMAPEYGATTGFFPVDEETLNYMRLTGRPDELVDLVEKYHKAQDMFFSPAAAEPVFTATLSLDMSTVTASIAGPSRPQDRINLNEGKVAFYNALTKNLKETVNGTAPVKNGVVDSRAETYSAHKVKTSTARGEAEITHGSIVVAAITSCTNTSNPSVLVAAGLVAQKAVEHGLKVPAHVKTSLAPGSRVVTGYLQSAGLDKALDAIGFQTVGYGCTTCIGNTGPIDPALSAAIKQNKIVAASVLSGNRNFEGRIHPDVRANFLASPPLVVAYALAGSVDIDVEKEPIGHGKNGPVYLKDLWPTTKEVSDVLAKNVNAQLFKSEYSNVLKGNDMWNAIKVSGGSIYNWSDASTYIRKPTYFDGFSLNKPDIQPLQNLATLAILGDSVTTDHISPAGDIEENSPAGKWLKEHGVAKADFNSYGSRRGNHEIMMRGTFANIRIKNKMVPGTEGGYTSLNGEVTTIYDAAMAYKAKGQGTIVLAGKEYGTGSSRDWAAKGPALLGIRAVIAESFERIHRSNLIGMGVFPFQFIDGQSADSLGLTGAETFSFAGIDNSLKPRQIIEVMVSSAGSSKNFKVMLRADTAVEIDYLRHGGILHAVLRNLGA